MRFVFLFVVTLGVYASACTGEEAAIIETTPTVPVSVEPVLPDAPQASQMPAGQKLVFHTECERMAYVAERLGLLRLPSSSVACEWQQMVTSYKIPLSICSGFLVGGIAGYTLSLLSSYHWVGQMQDSERCYVICILFSILIAYAILEVFQAQQAHVAGTFLRNLETFFADWTFNKEAVPLVLLPLFQEMYELYLMYGRRLPLHKVMIEELRRIVMYYWMRGVAELDSGEQDGVAVDVCVGQDSPVTVQTQGYATTTVR